MMRSMIRCCWMTMSRVLASLAVWQPEQEVPVSALVLSLLLVRPARLLRLLGADKIPGQDTAASQKAREAV